MRLIIAVLLCSCALAAQTKKILLMGGSPDMVRELGTASPKARIVPVTRATVMQEIGDADAIIGDISPAMVRAGKNLRWAQITSAGVERVLHLSGTTDLRDSQIVLTNNKINQGPEISDHAMALLLSLTRNINRYVAQKGTWVRAYPAVELNGRTAVVIGLGGIGTQIAVRANAFGMEVIGVDPEDKPFMPFVKTVVKPDQLNDVLPKADVVFISAPHTPKSHKMMGPDQFNLMKQGAYFIAVSRGALYDMDGLVRALDSRRLAGAGVDVTDPEPLPPGHPLWKFDNAIITPHAAGQSDKIGARTTALVKENVRRFVEGLPLINVVDKQKGY